MKISRDKNLTVSMGNFEFFRFGASVEVTSGDLGLTQSDVTEDPKAAVKQMHDFAVEMLNDLLAEDVREAAELTDERKSFILSSLQPPKPKKRSR